MSLSLLLEVLALKQQDRSIRLFRLPDLKEELAIPLDTELEGRGAVNAVGLSEDYM